MIIDMHHIITDGASMGWLIAESMQLAAGDTLPALTLQYKDFAHWHNQQQTPLRNNTNLTGRHALATPYPKRNYRWIIHARRFSSFRGKKCNRC